MGILAEPLEFVRSLPLPPKFDVCELGDQFITHGERRLAREFYEKDMKCGRYMSIDGNGRNGAHVHDLNLKIPKSFGQFHLVTDFGTGEHVFNQAQVFKTLHNLVRPGFYIAFDRPIAGYPRHCYYLIQPDLLLDLAAANQYEVIHMAEQDTTRGRLVRGVFRRASIASFVAPQQGRYRKLLRPITGELSKEERKLAK